MVLAAHAAEALGLSGKPVDAALASTNKRVARERFVAGGLAVPWHRAIDIDTDPARIVEGVEYPAVLKPVGLSGSRGVIRVNDDRELVEAFARVRRLLMRPEIRALRTGTERELLIEQFIPGHEFAVEGLLTGGALVALALFDKPDPLDGPFFEETIYVTPANVPDSTSHAIVDAVARAARALGLRHGPVHAECRANASGVYVLEVAARPIGGLCARVLRFARGGRSDLSLEHVLLRHAAGEDVSDVKLAPDGAAVMMIPIDRKGIFRRVEGEEEARDVPFVEDVRITAKQDQLLEPLPEAGCYLGFIFARAPRAADAEAAVRAAHQRLRFTIDVAIPVS